MTVTGSGFSHVASVLFGSTAGSRLHVVSSSKLTVVVPKHAAGAVDVRVTVKSGTKSVTSAKASADRYTYAAPPAVTAVSPSAGVLAGGTTVTVTGTGFSGITEVLFVTTAGTGLKVLSTTRLTVTAPAHGSGTVGLRVVGVYGTSASGPRTVTPTRPPRLSPRSPPAQARSRAGPP